MAEEQQGQERSEQPTSKTARRIPEKGSGR